MSSAFSTDEELIGRQGGSVTTAADELDRLQQTLFDLQQCGGSSVSLVHCPSAAQEKTVVGKMAALSRRLGWVSATLSLAEHPIDAVDQLVSQLFDSLRAADFQGESGILRLLAEFSYQHGDHAAALFAERCEPFGAVGDLTVLCQSYLAAKDDAHREANAFSRWSCGQPPARRGPVVGVRGVLSPQTGQRVLGELSRVVLALNYKGLAVFLAAGDSISRRSTRQRERGYTLLREVVDNFDSGKGAINTRVVLTGADGLFSGPQSLQELPPLFARLQVPARVEPPPPHRTWTSLVKEPYQYLHRRIAPPEDARPGPLRSLIRLSQGVPPVDAVAQMSVGHERIDRSIDRLFQHASMSGSVFQALCGEYGSGKTHLLLHLADRALRSGRPVFWLNLERMNLDLGNPARHLHRVIEQSVLPLRGRPSALSRLAQWTRSRAKTQLLLTALGEIAASESAEAKAARKLLALVEGDESPGAVLESFLSARDLSEKSGSSAYRLDAYRRLLLWTALLREMEGAEGPVVLIDEAENLYTSGVSEAQRRSALRSLSFYCGGTLPGACVIMAMTPEALAIMRKESGALLREAASSHSTLDLEDVALFRHRLKTLKPDEVPALSSAMRRELARKVRAVHRSVRGPVEIEDWEGIVSVAVRAAGPPRLMMRALVDQLESAWWSTRG